MDNILTSLPAFIILIGIVVTIHELGHFLAAKFCGVGVLKFSVGFGPALWKKRIGATEYQISIIPLGGFVRMVGDMPDMITGEQVSDKEVRNEESNNTANAEAEEKKEEEPVHPEVQALIDDKSKWFIEKNFWQKSLIVIAGPLFNIILALFIAIFASTFYGLEQIDGTKIGGIFKDSPAENAGLEAGDRIISISGKEVSEFDDLLHAVQNSEGKVLDFQISRGDKNVNLQIKPEPRTLGKDGESKVTNYMIGVRPGTILKDVSFVEAVQSSFIWVGTTSYLIVDGLVGLFQQRVPLDSLGGPILIYQVAGEKASEGLLPYLMLLAVINVTLGILNLLPIPVLDGGHLVMFAVEAVIGDISVRKKEAIQSVGFFLLLAIMFIAFKNDLTRDVSELKEKEISWDEMEEK